MVLCRCHTRGGARPASVSQETDPRRVGKTPRPFGGPGTLTLTPTTLVSTMQAVMSTRFFLRGLASRVAWTAKHPTFVLRLFWYRLDAFPWIVALIVAAIGGAIALVLVATHERHLERQELLCLARNIYFEARGEPAAGQYAVAEVTMNRYASGRYGDTVCEVVYYKRWDPIRKRYVGAFSWTEFAELPAVGGKEWLRAVTIAEAVYSGQDEPVLDDRTMFFHATWMKPEWADAKRKVARIGGHVFYK
jgi:N-acetylmuramoyl-L-alanine amidase